MKKLTIMMLPEFLKNAASLSKELKAKLVKTLRLMSEDIKHPSLQSKRVKSARGEVFECRVDKNIRLIYDWSNDALRCWYIGEHDVALKIAAVNTPNILIDDIIIKRLTENYSVSDKDLSVVGKEDDLNFIEINIDSFENEIR